MDKKDIRSLMEAYEDVLLDKEVSHHDDDFEDRPDPEVGLEVREAGEDDYEDSEMPEHHHDQETLEDNEHEKYRMVHAHLCTIRSHAHEVKECIENGANIEPWMEEKIALANDYIVHVANAIMYRK